METTEHQTLIVDQFSKQAIAFSNAKTIADAKALQLLIDAAGAGPEDTVLDVACGGGNVVCAFARVVRRATGIDMTPAMIERAQALQQSKGRTNMAWRIGDVLPLPFRNASFALAFAAVFAGPPLLGGGGFAGFAFGRFGIDPAGIFAGFFQAAALTMFIFGLPGVISAFFADRQLLLYAAAPISTLQLYLARLLQATVPAALVGVVVLATIFGYGIGARLNPIFGLLAIVLVAALALTVVSVEVCLLSLILRVVPATRARDVRTPISMEVKRFIS